MAQDACTCLLVVVPLPWLMVIGGAAIALMLVMVFVFNKLRMRGLEGLNDAQRAVSAGFDLADLEAMLANELISDVEFRRLRDMLINKAVLKDTKQTGLADANPLQKEQAADNEQLEPEKDGTELSDRPKDVDDNEDVGRNH